MQAELFHEDEYSALTHVVSALGGPLVVGKQMHPHLKDGAAERRVCDCLNRDRSQQFHPSEIIWLLKEAQKIGVHSGMAYFNRECGYGDPEPVNPVTEAVKLRREIVETGKSMERMFKQLERLALPGDDL